MRLRFRGKVRWDDFSTSCIWYDSGTKSESKLCFCLAFAEPNCNLVRHDKSTMSELGLTVAILIQRPIKVNPLKEFLS